MIVFVVMVLTAYYIESAYPAAHGLPIVAAIMCCCAEVSELKNRK